MIITIHHKKKSIVEFDSITKDIITDVYTENIVDA